MEGSRPKIKVSIKKEKSRKRELEDINKPAENIAVKIRNTMDKEGKIKKIQITVNKSIPNKDVLVTENRQLNEKNDQLTQQNKQLTEKIDLYVSILKNPKKLESLRRFLLEQKNNK